MLRFLSCEWQSIFLDSIIPYLRIHIPGIIVVTSHVVNDVQRSYRPANIYYNPPIKIIHIKEWVPFVSFNPVSLGLHHTLSLSNATSWMLYASSLSYTRLLSYTRPRRHLSSQIIISCAGKSDNAMHIWTIVAYHQTFPSSSFQFLEPLPLPSKTHPQSRGVWWRQPRALRGPATWWAFQSKSHLSFSKPRRLRLR